MNKEITLPAPAKLNLFLHITGRRQDGYHELETLFQFVDLADQITFRARDDGEFRLSPQIEGVSTEENLIIKAARALRGIAGDTSLGADINLTKNLPMGGGLGGGSSDAATTLIALNALWHLNLSYQELADIGVKLGADVPIFIHGEASLARGVGEELEAASPSECWYVIVHPQVHVSTAAVFTHPELPRSTKPIHHTDQVITGLNWQQLGNDCQQLVFNLYPSVAAAHQWLLQYAASKMTGTGACLFAPFSSENEAKRALASLPKDYRGWVAKGMNRSTAHLALAKQLED
ncbi:MULTISPECIES: 4-(cytidine 5'-diphospho)-2-C-methyl-D-erythritol kinase [Gammaproteobacteria]|uniref:4-(cytidine 5'-diphospho)-2-C-methyl-D-erythritol kinase n=1 Tax=Gammaproteobacteria TaxID=1236 RepID=UPI000DD0DAD6|nr:MULTISPECIES: 4-(cytidine 5'-diphospho)-2-C-methyl-D-erythritol kinase [Gammaproteobacteria]RTE87427.1 4-(cytidine 5'-diphospho)-2-C-methyl-D-erythritol kinase [Aliidiomarina sp. B3213]TCZ92788.1 4-(cytidine 5'-diphospho)-2-C-methyl-D-erythritol kinase [Lysobacter sp. N42]